MKDHSEMKEIIQFAEKGGYKGHFKYLPLILPRVRLNPYILLESHESDIFFDYDFLKAVFQMEWQSAANVLVMLKAEHRRRYILNFIRGRNVQSQETKEDQEAREDTDDD